MSATAAERLPHPPLPLAPGLRADVAHRRADGHSWEVVGSALGFDPDGLRRACAADPAFAAALDEAVAEAGREAELGALARLKRLTASEDERVALRASQVIMKYAHERRRERAAAARSPADEGPKPVESPRPTEAPKPKTAPSARGFVPHPKPAGAFRAVPDLPPDRLAELVRGG